MDDITTLPDAWLVWIATPIGPRPQIWFEDKGRFVGPSDLTVLSRRWVPVGSDTPNLDILAQCFPFTEQQEAA